jgi:hypothetical protein
MDTKHEIDCPFFSIPEDERVRWTGYFPGVHCFNYFYKELIITNQVTKSIDQLHPDKLAGRHPVK